MNNTYSYLYLIILLYSCNQQPSTVDIESTRMFSESYQPPVFISDDRKEKVLEVEDSIHKLFEEHLTTSNIPGIAYGIVVDNELVLASAVGMANRENDLRATLKTSFRIASMTKSFTAMAILKLRDDGKLSLEDPVVDYVPGMAKLRYLSEDAPVIDIENLLTMTAGFPEDNAWGDRQLAESDQMLLDLIAEEISFSNASSYQFEYSNLGYALLGNIITRVSGVPYQEYIRDNIFLPLGMENTYWEYENIPEDQLALGYRWEDEQWKLEPMLHHGSFGAMGGIITSIEDFSKYVSFQLSAWPPRSDPDSGPVSRSSLREMQTPQFTNRLHAWDKDHHGEPCPTISGYGYGLGISKDCHGRTRVTHGGALPGFGSNYAFFPKYGIGMMAFGNLTYTSPWPYSKVKQLLFESAGLEPRQLPVSDILAERQLQVVELIQNWDPDLEAKILAENFYLDQSREHRKEQVQQVLEKAGTITKTGELKPRNQLRGGFNLEAEHGTIEIYFSLSPEHDPKIQYLAVEFIETKK